MFLNVLLFMTNIRFDNVEKIFCSSISNWTQARIEGVNEYVFSYCIDSDEISFHYQHNKYDKSVKFELLLCFRILFHIENKRETKTTHAMKNIMLRFIFELSSSFIRFTFLYMWICTRHNNRLSFHSNRAPSFI
jgi:hypothetical protein